MQQIRLLSVKFDRPIKHFEIPAFRAAIVEKVGLEHDLYHNHDNSGESESGYHYRYPLVQYRLNQKHPSILFLERGVDEAHHFFTKPDWSIEFTKRQYQTKVADLKVVHGLFGVSDEWHTYSVKNWQALNQKNFKAFQATYGLIDRIQMLEKLLCGHLIALAKGLEHRYDRRFEVKIMDCSSMRFLPFSGVKVATFDIRFKTNVVLPSLVGLGKGVRVGFGVLQKDSETQGSENHTN